MPLQRPKVWGRLPGNRVPKPGKSSFWLTSRRKDRPARRQEKAKEDSQTQAQRALEDAEASDGSDSTEKINALDLDAKKKSLEKLEKLKEDQGQILSPVKGVVTEVRVGAGDNTPYTALMTLADVSSGCRFVAQIDKSLEKYIARKDPVKLSCGGQ